ncbi:radical SAM protein [Prochlorococcus sp. MIT 1303]|uniref:radical SAM/SPASM domain-containing protein n=1 Tax=Prochlorococcus sp. MIT 1303 TaxID=1723647 RepID=UPI0007B39F47|nr:radical SAM protein [Prochlorococcus sp. MIT 1303]KZR62105.1 hypothetical protein PMIT1303_02308 [Prochlorococcus sp. MIT 1303]
MKNPNPIDSQANLYFFRYANKDYMINANMLWACELTRSIKELVYRYLEQPDTSWTNLEKTVINRLGIGNHQQLVKTTDCSSNHKQISINSIALFVIQECNMSCTYCYGVEGRYGSGGKMDEKTAYSTVDWLIKQSNENKELQINFFGGEPLLAFDLVEKTINYAETKAKQNNKKISFGLNTNGTLLNQKIIDFLKQHNTSISVSFDGEKAIQDKVRPLKNGKSSYDKIVPNLKLLLSSDAQTHVHTVLSERNDLERSEKAISNIGIQSMTYSIETPLRTESNTVEHKRDISEILKTLSKEKQKIMRLITDRNSSELSRQNGLVWNCAKQFLGAPKRQYHCNAGRNYAAVSVSGDVYLCHRFVGDKKHKVGSISHGKPILDDYQKSNIETHPTCRNCFAKLTCGGGCYHENFTANDSDFEPNEDFCKIQRKATELGAVVTSQLDQSDLKFLQAVDFIPKQPCPIDLF